MLNTRRLQTIGLGVVLAGALASAPFHFGSGPLSGLGAAAAFAKDGGGHSGSGSGGSGSGSGNSGSGSGSGGGSGSNSGRSSGDDHGRQGADDGPGDDHGGQRADRGTRRNEDGARNRGLEHIDPATGAKVEVSGNDIEVVHPDGTKEEIENGRFERKDVNGRTIVQRPATDADAARLRAFAG